MNDAELERLMTDLEADHAERKQVLKGKEQEIRQAVCAFANDLPGRGIPGVLFVGVDDGGSPTGLPITDALLRALADIRSDGNILPIPTITVEKRRLRGVDVAVVTVKPADAPPVRYKGVVWVRIGPRRAVASPQEERLLAERNRWRDTSPDIRPLVEARLDDLDQHLLWDRYLPAAVDASVLAGNHRDPEAQLASLRLAHPTVPPVPTVLGMLVAGLRPTTYLPMAYLSFLRLAGPDLADPVVTSHELQGPLPRLIPQIDELVHLHVLTKVDITSASTELRQPDYPVPALQQLVRNAILHRTYEGTNTPVRVYWYSDRIEIISPGGPYGIVTRDNFGEPGVNDYRNPHLAEAMRHLGYVQRFGVGIGIARDALARNGNPPPDFQVEPYRVLVRIRRRQA
ncbi:MAG: ATP-binding protein [Thermodesulfobacteriota bacterium]